MERPELAILSVGTADETPVFAWLVDDWYTNGTVERAGVALDVADGGSWSIETLADVLLGMRPL